jgi:hypothetical protein
MVEGGTRLSRQECSLWVCSDRFAMVMRLPLYRLKRPNSCVAFSDARGQLRTCINHGAWSRSMHLRSSLKGLDCRHRHAAVMAAFTFGLPVPPSVESGGLSVIEIVNGYICMNCCDVDKARMNEDPHQSANQVQKKLAQHFDKLAPANFGPAVTLGGSLQAPAAGSAADPAPTLQASQNPASAAALSSVNLLV